MPTLEHNALVEMFREHPELAPRLLATLFHVEVPPHASVAVVAAHKAMNQTGFARCSSPGRWPPQLRRSAEGNLDAEMTRTAARSVGCCRFTSGCRRGPAPLDDDELDLE